MSGWLVSLEDGKHKGLQNPTTNYGKRNTEQNKPEKKGSYCMISLTQNSRTGKTITLIETRPVVKDGGGID